MKSFRSAAITCALILVVSVLGYTLSVGPVFATRSYLGADSRSWAHRVYAPLYQIAPDSTLGYVRLWGASSLDVTLLWLEAQSPASEDGGWTYKPPQVSTW